MRKSIIVGAAFLAAAFAIGYGVGQVTGAIPGFAAGRSHVSQQGTSDGARTGGQVTGITDTTITVSLPNGPWGPRSTATTIATTPSTQYVSFPGQSAKRSDIKMGTFVMAEGTLSSDGKTLTATRVGIRSGSAFGHPMFGPRAGGVVKNVQGSTITVTAFDGSTQTIAVDSSTKYFKERSSASLSDVTTGSRIHADGTLTNGVLHATAIEIEVPHVAGKVTGVNGSTYTIAAFAQPWDSTASTTVTVIASSNTKYFQGRGTAASASAVKNGSTIVAEGALSSDGKTLHADRIMILPSSVMGSPGSGFFGHHRFGPDHGMWGNGPMAPPASSGNAPNA